MCEYQATRTTHLSIHVKNVHQKSDNINCTECNKSIQKQYLTKHMKLFYTGEQTQFECKICTFKSIYKSSLNDHVKGVHQKSKK